MNSIGQFFLALFVGWCFYMLAMAMTLYDGLMSLVVQPFLGAIVTSLALMPVFAVGLPIRFVAPIHRFWLRCWWLSIVLGVIALGLMYASWLPPNRVQIMHPELKVPVDSFEPWRAIGGWLLAMFAAGHFYPPGSTSKR